MSIQQTLRDSALDMAQGMVDRARTPQQIIAAKQQLAAMVQSGRGEPYKIIPLIDVLNKNLTQAQQRAAQVAMGPQAPADGPPIAQQVMAQAQAPQPGVAALPSQLPAEYAHGGIVAFEDGGEVERYQNQGLVGGQAAAQLNALLARMKLVDPSLNVDYVRNAFMQAPIGKQQQILAKLSEEVGAEPVRVSNAVQAAPAEKADPGYEARKKFWDQGESFVAKRKAALKESADRGVASLLAPEDITDPEAAFMVGTAGDTGRGLPTLPPSPSTARKSLSPGTPSTTASLAPNQGSTEFTPIPRTPQLPASRPSPFSIYPEDASLDMARGESPAPTPDAQVTQAAVAADPAAAQAAISEGGVKGLSDYVGEYKKLLASQKGEGTKAYEEYLKNLPGKLDRQQQMDMYGALAQFGLNLASNRSPTLAGAIGEAGKVALPSAMAAMQARRKAEAEALKSRAELDRLQEARDIKAVELGGKTYEGALDRASRLEAAQIAAGKPTDMRSYVNDFVEAARAKGDKTTPDAVLREKATRGYLELYGASALRGAAAADQVGVAQERVRNKAVDDAADRVSKLIGVGGDFRKQYQERQKQDRENRKAGKPTNLAEEYREQLLQKELRRGQPKAAPAAPATAGTRPTSATPVPNAGAIAALKKDPTPQQKKFFDEVFGPGAADRALGK